MAKAIKETRQESYLKVDEGPQGLVKTKMSLDRSTITYGKLGTCDGNGEYSSLPEYGEPEWKKPGDPGG